MRVGEWFTRARHAELAAGVLRVALSLDGVFDRGQGVALHFSQATPATADVARYLGEAPFVVFGDNERGPLTAR